MSELVGTTTGIDPSTQGTEEQSQEVRASQKRAVSYSALKSYEACPHRLRLKLDKAPVLPREENRGTLVHEMAERYVRGEIEDLPRELRKFEAQFIEDRAIYAAGNMAIEEEWGFDRDWEPTSWYDAEIRVKCDQVLFLADHELRIVDHKTGKHFGNEVPHLMQAQFYALAAFMKYPKVEVVETEMRYLDHGKAVRKLWSRGKDALRLLTTHTRRFSFFFNDKLLQPRPSRMNCRFCPYSNNEQGSNACGYSVSWDSL